MATLIVPDHFSACKGWGTDKKAIISILGNRNAAERKEISRAYEQLHREDLLKRLESKLSEDFEVLYDAR